MQRVCRYEYRYKWYNPGEIPIDGTLDEEQQEKVDFVLENFSTKTAYELEAITTIDYVAVEILKNQGNDEEIIDKVQKIKGTKFSKEYLADCLRTLKCSNYIS